MALQLNPVEVPWLDQWAASPFTSVSENQRYGQPLLVQDWSGDLIRDVFRSEYKNEPGGGQSAPSIGGRLSVLAAWDHWSAVLSSIDGLMTVRESEDVPATAYAYRAARSVVESAYGLLQSGKRKLAPSIPAPIVVTDDRGGVKLAWEHGAKHVRVRFGANPELRSYLYFESQAGHDVEDLQPSTLKRRLDWLLTP